MNFLKISIIKKSETIIPISMIIHLYEVSYLTKFHYNQRSVRVILRESNSSNLLILCPLNMTVWAYINC
jgi:hypothetical protein